MALKSGKLLLKNIRNMVRVISSSNGSILLWAILVFDSLLKVSGNAEGDALNALKNNLADPNNVLQSWDATDANPCMWFRVTCNSDNKVIRIDLGDENLSGQLVPQLGQLQSLQYLELSGNSISGKIPEALGNLTNLVSLDLYNNTLTGPIPDTLANLKSLRYLELFGNNISGKIPEELGNLTNLVRLELFINRLTGPIPDTLANLKKLRYLRLHNNSLSGNIPMSLTNVVSLQFLELSNNLLEGEIPINGSFSLFTPISFNNNPRLKWPEIPPSPPMSPMPPASSGSLMLVPRPISPMPPAPSGILYSGGVVAGTAVLYISACAFVFAYWHIRKPQHHFFDVPAEKDSDEIQPDQLKHFSLFDLQVATDNFSYENIVGWGGSGKVYKGRLADGSLVAVKRLKEEHTPEIELQFQTETKLISMAVHRNLLRLIGFCVTPTEWLLVYPFMVNRCVASCLRERPETQAPLHWPARKRIALGAARGLAYLHDHCDPKIIHRDVKASNILLDEEFEAVIGDFGLAKLSGYRDTHVTTAVRGTVGHIAPEYLLTGRLTEKTDVFGYGVMLLELITGQRVFDLARLANMDEVMLLDRVKGLLRDRRLEMLVDSKLQGNYDEKVVEQLIQVSLICAQINHPLERPRMSEVVGMLEGDDFFEKWGTFLQNEEMSGPHFDYTHQADADWIADSTSEISQA